MLPDGPQKTLVNAVSERLHANKYFEAAKLVADWFKKTTGNALPVATKKEADEVLTLLLHWCLNNNGYGEAAQMLWGPTLFDPRPDSTRRVWAAFEQQDLILLMGAGSMSKSYSMGVRLFLEWIRDPDYTTVRVVGPSEKHLEDNLFSHLVALHQQSVIPLPGQVGKLFIGLDPRNRKSSISGVVIPLGQKKAAKLQGTKRVQRKVEHPVFGKTSRMFIFLDEIASIPTGIWRDIDNLMTGMGGAPGIQKIMGAFNPTEQQDEVGVRCEPGTGWQMFDPEADFEWTSARGWFVVRLDATRCENVLQKKEIYVGLQTFEGLERVARNSGGLDSPGYWSMGRGCFPPMGVPMSIIPAGLLVDLKAEVIWYETPTPCGGVDLALEGADTAVFVKGCAGLSSGIKLPPSLQFPTGRTVMFKNAKGRNAPRWMLLAETLLRLPKGDSLAMKAEILRIARSFSIKPNYLAVDRTGNGQGVVDLLRFEFGEVIGVNFNEGCGTTRVMAEDHAVASELYTRLNTEMMFAVRKFIEFGYLKLALGLPTDNLFPQLTGRRYKSRGKDTVESKPDYASRNQGKSPDEADALCLLLHAARKGFGIVPSMTGENTSDLTPEGDYDDYSDNGGVRISADNRTESLDM